MVNGTLINYYIHCKRQCYLFGNKLTMEDNEENVLIGRAIHKERAVQKNTEIVIDNIKLDKLTREYLTEVKKSDADIESARWQLLYYLYVLKQKGVVRKGRLEFVEKKKQTKKTMIIELTDDIEKQLLLYTKEIENLLQQDKIPEPLSDSKCKKCAYYQYCYI